MRTPSQTTKSNSDLQAVIKATEKLWRRYHLTYDQTRYVAKEVRRALEVQRPPSRVRVIERLSQEEERRLIDTAGQGNGRSRWHHQTGIASRAAACDRDHATRTRDAVGADSEVPRSRQDRHHPNLCGLYHRDDQRELSAGLVTVTEPYEGLSRGDRSWNSSRLSRSSSRSHMRRGYPWRIEIERFLPSIPSWREEFHPAQPRAALRPWVRLPLGRVTEFSTHFNDAPRGARI